MRKLLLSTVATLGLAGLAGSAAATSLTLTHIAPLDHEYNALLITQPTGSLPGGGPSIPTGVQSENANPYSLNNNKQVIVGLKLDRNASGIGNNNELAAVADASSIRNIIREGATPSSTLGLTGSNVHAVWTGHLFDDGRTLVGLTSDGTPTGSPPSNTSLAIFNASGSATGALWQASSPGSTLPGGGLSGDITGGSLISANHTDKGFVYIRSTSDEGVFSFDVDTGLTGKFTTVPDLTTSFPGSSVMPTGQAFINDAGDGSLHLGEVDNVGLADFNDLVLYTVSGSTATVVAEPNHNIVTRDGVTTTDFAVGFERPSMAPDGTILVGGYVDDTLTDGVDRNSGQAAFFMDDPNDTGGLFMLLRENEDLGAVTGLSALDGILADFNFFDAKLGPNGEFVLRSNSDYLIGRDSDGDWGLLMQPGDIIDGREVRNLSLRSRRMTAGGDFVLEVDFTNGETGIYIASLPENGFPSQTPGIPAPAAGALMLVGLGLLSRRR